MKVFGNYFYFCRSKEQCKTSKRKTWVVYHLHWLTGQFTVWPNGKQNSALVNFVPKSRLTFAQISSIYRKTGKYSEDGRQ